MKKLLFYAFLIFLVVSCSQEQSEIIPKQSKIKLEKVVYVYEHIEYKVNIDFTNENNPKILKSFGQSKLEEILKLPKLVTVLNDFDERVFFFKNKKEYKTSLVYKDVLSNHKKSLKKSTRKSVVNSVTFYADANYQGTSLTRSGFSYEPNFSQLYKSNGQSWNDQASSMIIRNSYARIFEHANYGGQSWYFNYPTITYNVSYLGNLRYGGFWFFTRNWNDKISSAKVSSNPL